MTLFWIVATGMIVLALVFVLSPLLGYGIKAAVNSDQLNIEVIKQQLLELESDLKNAKLDQSEYESARRDLEKELLYDLSHEQGKTNSKPMKQGRWVGAMIAVVVPLIAVVTYQQIGSSESISLVPTDNQAASSVAGLGDGQAPSVEEMVAKLAARLESEPNNPEGWFLLARSYMAMQRYADAARAYEQLLSLVSDDAQILVSYADALAMIHNGQLAGKPLKLVNRALELDPNQAQGLWLAGMAADQAGEYETAVNYWRRLEPLLTNEPESLAELRQLIARAEQVAGITSESSTQTMTSELGSSETSAQQPKTAPATSQATITVAVKVDPELADRSAPEDSVFVFARALQGPPMPLAVIRMQVKDLPLTVDLNDSMSIMPTMRLSQFSEVKVGARISKSGNAAAQTGDFYGEVAPVSINGKKPIQITINEEVP